MNILKLSDLVAAIGQSRVTILTLRIHANLSAELGSHVGQVLNGRGPKEEVLLGDAGEGLREVELRHCCGCSKVKN